VNNVARLTESTQERKHGDRSTGPFCSRTLESLENRGLSQQNDREFKSDAVGAACSAYPDAASPLLAGRYSLLQSTADPSNHYSHTLVTSTRQACQQ
jgi:hypothetical protein